MSFPPYRSYQDSGIKWLGSLPSHWKIERLGNLYREVSEAGSPEFPVLSVSIHTGVSDEEADADDSKRKIVRSEDRSKYKRVSPNDLTYNMMRAWQGGFGTVQVEGMVSPAYVVARPRTEVPSRYIELLLRTPGAVEEMRRHSRGITDFRLRLYWDQFKDIRVALPPTEERNAILAFLDHEMAKIDALVEEQRRLIELLKEKRQAVISHTVVKGLDPSVAMKDSGVEWLGEVPAHWEVNRLDRLMSFSSGKAHEPFLDENGEHIYISARFVSTHGQSLKYCTENLTPAKRGDVVMVMSDLPNGRALARAYQIADNASYAVNQRVCRLNRFRGSARYFYYQLNRNPGLRRYDDGVNQTHLSNSAYCKLLLCAPPEPEQAKIAKYLDDLTGQIDDLQVAATSAVSVLQERRAALISAAVTGKIDVRGALTKQVEAA